jgi:hypothetical protein
MKTIVVVLLASLRSLRWNLRRQVDAIVARVL